MFALWKILNFSNIIHWSRGREIQIWPINNLFFNKVFYDVCNGLLSWYTTISNYHNSNSEQINLNCSRRSQNKGIQILPLNTFLFIGLVRKKISLFLIYWRLPSFNLLREVMKYVCFVVLANQSSSHTAGWIFLYSNSNMDNIFPNLNFKFPYISSYINNLK